MLLENVRVMRMSEFLGLSVGTDMQFVIGWEEKNGYWRYS
jgi:hypothetical protein